MKRPFYLRFNDMIRKMPNGCWEWKGHTTSGNYGRFVFEGKGYLAHRFSYVLHNGPIPEGLIVRHTCDNRICVNPDHLILGTHKDNMQDALDRNRMNQRRLISTRKYKKPPVPDNVDANRQKARLSESGNSSAKLDPEKVLYIRKRAAAGDCTTGDLARELGVSAPTICAVITGQSWRHVK